MSSHGASPSQPGRGHRLLYGQTDHRGGRVRARIGLITIGFATLYAILALRIIALVSFGEHHGVGTAFSREAIGTARPDVLDRNGELLATDVKAPSLYGEPRRIIDKDEAVELLTAALPDVDAPELRSRLASRKGFVWLKREIDAQQQQFIHRSGI